MSRISEHMINMLSAHWHRLRQTVKSFCVRIWQRPLLLSAGMMWNLCAVCVAKGMEFLNAPYETIQKVTEDLVRSDGERYCFSKSQEEVDTLLWEAQLKYVFPLVENYRRYFVKKYYDFIKAVLPINNGYGDQVMVPEEAELGNLMYLVERGGIPVSAEESMELKRYRKARNELAHMNLLSNEELCVILKAGKHKTASD